MTKTNRSKHARKPRIPLEELKRTVDEISLLPGWDDEDSQAALVMLAPLSIGVRDPKAVSRFTGVPLAQVLEFHRRLEVNRVLPPGAMVSSVWADPKDGKKLFLMDVYVATGKLRRANRGTVAKAVN
jgi:hypothetical protein